MQWLILGLALLLLSIGALILIGLYRRNIAKKKTGKEIKCSKCGRIIPISKTSISDDIRRGGGVVIGGGSLDTPMYQCTICESCGSVFCDSCQRPSPDPCPQCGKSNLRPGFADLVQKYYKS
jgi:hypothetical protein